MSNIYLNIYGGLGNQLFQIAAAYYYLKKYSFNKIFLNTTLLDKFDTKRTFESYNFIVNLSFIFTDSNLIITKFMTLRLTKVLYFLPNCISKYEESICSERPLFMDGYFHDIPTDFFDVVGDLLDEWKSILFIHFKALNIERPHLGIHVRRGDYLSSVNKSIFKYLDDDYFINLVDSINNKADFSIVFSDDVGVINSFVAKLDLKNSRDYCTTLLDEIALLSHSSIIIMSNSTYSWWAAILSDSPMIYCPRNWYVNDAKNSRNNLLIDGFEYIENE